MEITIINLTAVFICLAYGYVNKRQGFALILTGQVLAYLALDSMMPDNPSNAAISAYYISASILLLASAVLVKKLPALMLRRVIAKHAYVIAAMAYALINTLCIITTSPIVFDLHDTFGSLFILLEVVTCLAWTWTPLKRR